MGNHYLDVSYHSEWDQHAERNYPKNLLPAKKRSWLNSSGKKYRFLFKMRRSNHETKSCQSINSTNPDSDKGDRGSNGNGR